MNRHKIRNSSFVKKSLIAHGTLLESCGVHATAFVGMRFEDGVHPGQGPQLLV